MSRSIRPRIRLWGILLATVPVLALGLFTGAISFHQQYRQTLADQARSAALLISQVEPRLLQAEQTLITALDASGRVFAHRDPAVVITAQTVDLPVHRGSGRTLEGRRALRSARTFAVRNLPFHLVVERRLANAFDLSFTMVAAVPAFAVLADAISSMVEQLQEKIAQVGSALNEREVLLRELHHRVKNNLQIIISLTNLQTDALVNPHDAEVFRALQHRIYSLALVHEQLYQSVSLSRIEIGRYLHAMLSYLNNNFHNPGREIEIRTEIDTVDAAIEPAVAFGMLISEVVSNSLKHGFADRTSGTLTVHLSHQSPAVVLSVRSCELRYNSVV